MKVSLRECTVADYPLMLAWRNNPLVNAGFYTQSKGHLIEWGEHLKWCASRNRDWRTFIILCDDGVTWERPVGVVQVGQLDHWSPEIGYYIGEVTLWGKGIGKEAVRLALEWIKAYGKTSVHTTVLKSNVRSLKLLKSLGFVEIGEAREGEVWLQKASL